jgi:hypothetical protein
MMTSGSEGMETTPVVCVGDVIWVMQRPYYELPTRNRTRVVDYAEGFLGGSVPNIARHIARIGRKARVVALVGGAEEERITSSLRSWGVEISGLIECGQSSNLLVAFVGERSARSIFVRSTSTSRALETMASELSAERVVLFGGSRDPAVLSGVRIPLAAPSAHVRSQPASRPSLDSGAFLYMLCSHGAERVQSRGRADVALQLRVRLAA